MIENDTILVPDRGGYLYLAQKLGTVAKKVYYCMPDTRPYPETHLAQIGCDLPEVERIEGDDKWKVLKKCDWVAFFDCYDPLFQQYLIDEGYPVYGPLGSAVMELDRIYLLDLMKELGMPIPKTKLVNGVSEMLAYLEKANDIKFIKGSRRGDFETKKFISMLQVMPWVNNLKARLGEMSEEIQILVQNNVEAVCEVGPDIFNVRGKYNEKPLIGYEDKDRKYAGRVMDEYPPIIKTFLDKLTPTFEKLGCQGNFTAELRITKDGKVFFTDSTNRAPQPPSPLVCELYEDWPNIVREIAHGRMPRFKTKAKYGAEIVLHSDWHADKNEIYVTFPKDVAPYVKLLNHTREGDGYYCIPNDNGGYFGGVIGMGNTLDQAISNATDVMETVEADDLTYEPSWDKVHEAIKAGRKFGITF